MFLDAVFSDACQDFSDDGSSLDSTNNQRNEIKGFDFMI